MAPKGPASLKVLENALEDQATDLPSPVREMGAIYLDQIARLTEVIEQLADELEAAAKTAAQLRRLCTIPGIGDAVRSGMPILSPTADDLQASVAALRSTEKFGALAHHFHANTVGHPTLSDVERYTRAGTGRAW